MADNDNDLTQEEKASLNRMPEDSAFFEKVLPVLFVVMTILTIGLITFAAAVLLGLFNF
ncbi:MAG: hypothetical protein OEY93_06830 [Anaerolineae bacterium]|nr:hypothetical protein [Anaerolineae bacterium]